MKLPLAQFRREDFAEVDGDWMDRLLRPLNTQLKALGSILNNGLVFGDNVQGFTKEITTANASTSTTSSGWIVIGASGAPAFQNSWTNIVSDTPPCRFQRVGNVVHVELAVTGGAPSSTIFTLPAGYRPGFKLYITGRAGAGSVATGLVDAGGAVFTETANPIFTFSFVADDAPAATSSSLFPVKFKNELPGGRKPTSVLLVSAVDITNNTTSTPVSASNPAWATSGDQVVLSDVAGLVAGRRYKLTLRVE